MASNMPNVNTNFDPDYDSFLNLDNDFTPSATSPAIKSIPMLTPQSSIPGSATTFASSSTPRTFPGPSFQYDAYHQQTGIPIGALANTFAVNRASGLQYHEGNGGFIMPTETLNMPLSTLDEYDFSQGPDMDFDTDSPNDIPSMFYSETSSRPTQFVSPNTLVAHNMNSTPIQRIYPGMHSQQAAQAKAQQAQKQQIARQQQQSRPEGQKPLPSPTKSQASKDPLVEESISKVLNRMRQESITSTATDADGANVGMSNMPRIKKDEDDMDEDERLLASEEGKKLSSKERRQLRNKVSARAFRSRRKGKSCRHFIIDLMANLIQNILVNSRAKLPPKPKKPTTCVLRMSSSEKRTTVLQILLACSFLPKHLLASSKNSASQAFQPPTRRSIRNSNSKPDLNPNLNHRQSHDVRMSAPMRLLIRCKFNNLRLAWLLFQKPQLTSLPSNPRMLG